VGTEGSFPRVQWSGHEADHLPPSSAEAKNALPQDVFMAWYLSKQEVTASWHGA
jgi:hypothetical protein